MSGRVWWMGWPGLVVVLSACGGDAAPGKGGETAAAPAAPAASGAPATDAAAPAQAAGRAVAAAPAAPAAAPGGGETAQAVMARAQAAATARDWRTLAGCLTPDERLTWAFSALTLPKDAAEDEDHKAAKAALTALTADHAAVCKKHGVKPDALDSAGDEANEILLKALFAKVDTTGFVADVFAVAEKHGKGVPAGAAFLATIRDEFTGKVAGLSVDGDEGTAKFGDTAVKLSKVGGRWYLAVPEGE